MSLRLLLDTHALAWYNYAPERMPEALVETISDTRNQVFVSSITAWEMGLKLELGKWPEMGTLVRHFGVRLEAYGFAPLPYTVAHALRARSLGIPHRDPFDRALMGQALEDGLTLVSADRLIVESAAHLPELMLRWE